MPKIATKNRLISRRVGVVETTLDDVIFTTKQGFDEMGVRFDVSDRRFYRIENRLDQMDHGIVSIGDTLARQMTFIESEFAATRSHFERIDDHLEKIEEKFVSIDLKFDKIDAKFDTIDKKFDGMSKRFDAIDKKLGIA